jgi:hypothetical protein
MTLRKVDLSPYLGWEAPTLLFRYKELTSVARHLSNGSDIVGAC